MSEIMIRTSERSCFKTCRQKWKWAYVDRLRPKQGRNALEFGTLWHAAMEIYYKKGKKRGLRLDKAFRKVYKEYIEAGGQEFYPLKDVEALDLGIAMAKMYLEEFGKDEQYEVIQPEQTFQIDVHHPKTGKYLFTYVGQIDGVWLDLANQRKIFAEHKTGASLEPFGAPTYLDDQPGAYWTYGVPYLQVTGVLEPNEEIEYLMFNRARKAMPDTRQQNENGEYLNQNGKVSKKQPPPYFKREIVIRTAEERRAIMRRVRREVHEIKLARAGQLGIYKTPGKHCIWCEFLQMCEVHEAVSDWKFVRDQTMDVWDPYDAHVEEVDLIGS